MAWILIGAGVILASELLIRLPVRDNYSKAITYAKKSARTISSSSISDHWKEIALQAYSLRLGIASISAFGLLVLALSPFIVLGFFWDGGMIGLTQFLLDP